MLAEGKNSDQLVDVLLEEIGEGLLREKDFFPGLVGESLGSGNSQASLLRKRGSGGMMWGSALLVGGATTGPRDELTWFLSGLWGIHPPFPSV